MIFGKYCSFINMNVYCYEMKVKIKSCVLKWNRKYDYIFEIKNVW